MSQPTQASPAAALHPDGREYTLSDFDFPLPPELIAQHPAPERSASRLLDGSSSPPQDLIFRDLPRLLRPTDLLVFNDTRVIPARLYGQKASGGRVELLIERVLPGHEVIAHLKASKKPPRGATLHLGGSDPRREGFTATVLGRWRDPDGPLFHLRFEGEPHALMQRWGHIPLPPYIQRPAPPGASPGASEPAATDDRERYQTIFARHPGAVAAPTAALHFDPPLLARLDALGIQRASVTLHVGAGTFAPVKTERIAEHTMHSEWYDVPAATQDAIARCRARGGRIVTVGTTTVRTLESWAATGCAQGETHIFITPGFRFALTDALITNFHLPKSTLMMLVSAFAGYDTIRALYRHAIAQRYRFFSYGDAMWLTRQP